jgi:long-chain acyl-CoA synthetase
MPRRTLLDFFEDFSARADTFIVDDDGYRVRQTSYREVAAAARKFAARLTSAGVVADEKVVIWSENRTEWIVALWGCLLARAVLVPVDYRASGDLIARISAIVRAKIVLVGHEVVVPTSVTGEVWKLEEVIGDGPRSGAPSDIGTQAEGGTTASPRGRGAAAAEAPGPEPTSLAEIIFTSGATADPKGVTITHRNVLANIIPIEREITKYLRYARPFQPLRFLNLLPLSHMFGQSMATFVPPMLSGTVVFSHGYSPVEILRQIKSRRISVLVCVPKVLDVLREHVERVLPMTAEPDPLVGKHWAWRWWHYRHVRRLFGWKFWCIVCGAAPLDPALEGFWRKLGFLVVQGYGLTETAPIVTLNHPFRASRGTVGTPIGGVEVKIADDGEILVRGDNVTSGYYRPEGASASSSGPSTSVDPGSAFVDGWFHTGDIGQLDDAGRLMIKGRKKEMIVTPQGLNVFPDDVERALLQQPGVKDAGVVGVLIAGEERIHAVLVLEPGADLDGIVRGANARLEDHQRVWNASVWPGERLPRTEGTEKLKRRELQRWAAGESRDTSTASGPPSSAATTVEGVVARYAPGRTLSAASTLEELGLSSLDRVELMMALEEAFRTTLDESALAGPRTLGELDRLLRGGDSAADAAGSTLIARGNDTATVSTDNGSSNGGASDTNRGPGPSSLSATPIKFPSWNRSGPSWLLRRVSLPTWILPLGRIFMQIRVEGLEHLAAIHEPVIFASNHQSHLDTPAILLALPSRWRYRVAPAMAKEFFKPHFTPSGYSRKAWLTNSLNYYLACQFFNAFPLPQREAGTRQTLRYIGEITSDAYSVLIFPEGRRNKLGEIDRFMPGVGMIGSRLHVPVVPVRIEGLDKVLDPTMKWPKRGPVRVAFGAPLRLTGEEYSALAKEVEEAVRRL